MIKQFTLTLFCTFLLSGCPEDPIQGEPGDKPPQNNTPAQDAGAQSNNAADAGTTHNSITASDAGNSSLPSPSNDAGITSSLTSDAGHPDSSPSDAGTGEITTADAGNDSPNLLQGDAGLLDMPTLSADGGSFTPDAFLYIRNIYLPSGENGFVEIMINNDEPLGGLQFMISGVTPVAGSTTGGLIESTNGFTGTITAAGQFLGFTMTSDTLPEHNGTLTKIPISAIPESQICITDVVVSNATGTQLLSYAECKDAP